MKERNLKNIVFMDRIPRAELVEIAKQEHAELVKLLQATIKAVSPEAKIKESEELVVHLGDSVLTITEPVFHEEGVLLGDIYTEGPDVIASSSITLYHPVFEREMFGGAHSLWYCDAMELGCYDWYEFGFYDQFVQRPNQPNEPNEPDEPNEPTRRFDPFALSPEDSDARYPFSKVHGGAKHHWRPVHLNVHGARAFAERWASWLGHNPKELPRHYKSLRIQPANHGVRELSGERRSRGLIP